MRATISPGGHCELHVVDTGIGMTEQEIAHAMQPFTQIDNSLSRRFDGTGLSLPLTKALVELHSGELRLRSERGVGTTASISLPKPAGERLPVGMSSALQEEKEVAQGSR
jgi:signal transduction histidine kinase